MSLSARKIGPDTKRELLGASYGRVSTNDQFLDDFGNRKPDASPAAQKIRCQEHVKFLEQRRGIRMRLIEHIPDDGYSGKDLKRPGFQRLWRLIEDHKINFLVVTELSRLSRSVSDFTTLLDHMAKHGVDLHIIGMDLDTSTPQGKMVLNILVTLAQFERELTSQRVRENISVRLRTDGRINGATELLGLDRDPDKKGQFKINSREVDQVETLFNQYLRESGKKQVLEKAKERGITDKNGRPLTLARLNRIIENAHSRYRGIWREVRPDGTVLDIPLPHGALFTTTLLDKVVEKARDTFSKRKRSGAEGYVYLLTHILQHEDGSTFQGQPGKNRAYRYYYNRKNGFRVRCDELDELIIARIKSYLINSSTFERLVEQAIRNQTEELRSIDVKIRDIQFEINKLDAEDQRLKDHLIAKTSAGAETVHLWLEEQITKQQANRDRLNLEMQNIRTIRATVVARTGLSDLKKAVREFIDTFDRMTGTERRNLIERLLNRVCLRRDHTIELVLNVNPGVLPTEGNERKKVRGDVELVGLVGLEPTTNRL